MINPVELDASTALAVTRTRLAAERTLMSWIRTSFSMIGFGFTILKLFQYLKVNATTAHMVNGSSTKTLGIFLILLGLFCLIPGMIEHRRELTILHQIDGGSRWSYSFIVAILVGVLGLYALANALAIRWF